MTLSDGKALATDPGIREGTIVHDSYGKSKVRLTKLTRGKDRHELKEISVDIQLEGEFEQSYTLGDNSMVVATDSMKNTVYVLAAKHEINEIESFAKTLAAHFVRKYPQVRMASVAIEEELWHRISLNGKPHPFAFFGAGAEKRVTEVKVTPESVSITSGIENLSVVKTTDSAFWGFIRDEYTTLPEVKDRMFGTSISARWLYGSEDCNFNESYDTIRGIVLEVFATHMSLSVQQTLYEIGQSALARCSSVSSITLTMPNQHRLPFNTQSFGLEDRHEIFVNTSEPYGLISATIARK